MAKKTAASAAKMGRPQSPDGPRVIVAVSVPKSVSDALDAYAKDNEVGRSAVVVDALRAWLKRKHR